MLTVLSGKRVVLRPSPKQDRTAFVCRVDSPCFYTKREGVEGRRIPGALEARNVFAKIPAALAPDQQTHVATDYRAPVRAACWCTTRQLASDGRVKQKFQVMPRTFRTYHHAAISSRRPTLTVSPPAFRRAFAVNKKNIRSMGVLVYIHTRFFCLHCNLSPC